MNAKHTPGPWHVNAIKGNRIIGDETAEGAEKLHIAGANATVATAYRPRDARLIAAAPAMLEELYRCLPIVEDAESDPCYKSGAMRERIRSISAILAAIEGKP